MYKAHQLEEHGFPSDAHRRGAFWKLSVIKSHGVVEAGHQNHRGFPRVLLLRHPCAALVSEFRRQSWRVHAGAASAEEVAASLEGQRFFFEFTPEDKQWRWFLGDNDNGMANKTVLGSSKLGRFVKFMRDVDDEPQYTPALTMYYEEFKSGLSRALAKLFDFLIRLKPELATYAPNGTRATVIK